MDRSLITDLPRDIFVAGRKQRALAYLDRDDLKNAVASFVSSMSARPDCELPTPLGSAWRFATDGQRCARLEDADRRIRVMITESSWPHAGAARCSWSPR